MRYAVIAAFFSYITHSSFVLYPMYLIVPIAHYNWTILTISVVAGFTAESGLGADFWQFSSAKNGLVLKTEAEPYFCIMKHKVLRYIFRHDEESVTYNICWTTDIDYFFHMNNGKYFREMDFGRFDFYFRTGFDKYIQVWAFL